MTAINRTERRALARAEKLAARPVRRQKSNPDNVPLRAVPWRVREVFLPLDRIFDQIANEGAIECVRGKPVFREPETGWYEVAPALQGVVDFHALAASKHGVELDTSPLNRLAASLDAGKPLTEGEVAKARAAADAMRRFAPAYLTVGEAKSILKTVQISAELESMGEA